MRKRPWNIFFALMLIWSIVCTLCSNDIHTSFFGTENRYDGLLTYFFYAVVYMCANIIKDEKSRKDVLNSYAITSAVMGVCLLLQDYGVITNVFKKLELTTIAAAGCVIAYAVCAFTGNTMFYTTPYMFMFLGMAAKS